MAMDYGSSPAANCVLTAAGTCDMGASAVQLATKLHEHYGVPYDHIEVTSMLGGNDTVGEVFTREDVTTLVTFARKEGLGGLHI